MCEGLVVSPSFFGGRRESGTEGGTRGYCIPRSCICAPSRVRPLIGPHCIISSSRVFGMHRPRFHPLSCPFLPDSFLPFPLSSIVNDNNLAGTVFAGFANVKTLTVIKAMNNGLTGTLGPAFKRFKTGWKGNPKLCIDFNGDSKCEPAA
eukprot:TRINITY_DN1103_c0_g1_i1.p2 TRINITY_DN1103_c0_g1~~TRINITY_DN1103_c0_g1_i1.p2  ORF type:complete len:149 (-),score=3.70 TRINITY_DN1103_c0_g1_i1:191-637(-)